MYDEGVHCRWNRKGCHGVTEYVCYVSVGAYLVVGVWVGWLAAVGRHGWVCCCLLFVEEKFMGAPKTGEPLRGGRQKDSSSVRRLSSYGCSMEYGSMRHVEECYH